jgi:hypothetical protein
MKKIAGGGALAAVALFMLMGFFNSGVEGGAAIAALALVVGLPAAGSALLIRSHFQDRNRLCSRKAQLRRQTIESEILRLAGLSGGRLTAVEVATQLTMTPEGAKEALDGLALRSQADYEITDEGIIVYSFHDVRHLGNKESAKGLLDA